MSFDLVGRIKITDDGASRAFDKVTRATEEAKKAMDSLEGANRTAKRATDAVTSSSNQLSRTFDRVRTAAYGAGRTVRSASSAMSSAARQTGSLSRQVAALGAAYLTAKGAKSLFDKTIGAAATYEMQEITVQAMFGKGNEKAVDEYLDYVQKRADISMYEIGDFLGISKGFISTSKNNANLEKMVNLAERLAAIDPVQGLEGAGLALKEYFGGDSQSLVERFELSRKELNKWKSLPIERQLKELDNHLKSIGASNELLEAQSKTSLGEYRKAVGAINRAFREMGTEGLRKIHPLLEDFNKWLNGADFAKLREWGTDVFSGFVSGAVEMVRKATDYINNNFIDNPEFRNLPDIQAKVKYIFNTLWEDFRKWYDSDGRAKVQSIATDLTNTLGAALKASPQLIEAAAKIGVDLGAGIIKGVMSDPLLATLLGGGAAAKLLGGGKGGGKGSGGKGGGKFAALTTNPIAIGGAAALAGMGYSSSAWEGVKSDPNSIYSSKVIGGGSNAPTTLPSISDDQVDALVGWAKGHNGGLRNVPYSGYVARLHAGEAVLTRSEAARWRGEGGATGGRTAPTININGPIHINNGMDYDTFVRRLTYDLAM